MGREGGEVIPTGGCGGWGWLWWLGGWCCWGLVAGLCVSNIFVNRKVVLEFN